MPRNLEYYVSHTHSVEACCGCRDGARACAQGYGCPGGLRFCFLWVQGLEASQLD